MGDLAAHIQLCASYFPWDEIIEYWTQEDTYDKDAQQDDDDEKGQQFFHAIEGYDTFYDASCEPPMFSECGGQKIVETGVSTVSCAGPNTECMLATKSSVL